MTEVDADTVKSMFPKTVAKNINNNFQDIATAFDKQTADLDRAAQQHNGAKLTTEERKQLELFMYATVRAENASFTAKNESMGSTNSLAFDTVSTRYDKHGHANGVKFTPALIPPTSKYSLLGQPFSLYETGKRQTNLGNLEYGDGERYRGRGYLQITGHSNYRLYSKTVPGLEQNPALGEDKKNAAKILVAYILDHRKMILKSLEKGGLSAARSVVNGKPKPGLKAHGLNDFVNAYNAGTKSLEKKTAPASPAVKAAPPAPPKQTAGPSINRS